MKSARATTPRLSMTFIESYAQPEKTDELYCSSGSASDDENNDSSASDTHAKFDSQAATPTEQKRRPSLVIAGDAQALDSVRTVHSPRSQGTKMTMTTSPRSTPGTRSSETAPMPNLPLPALPQAMPTESLPSSVKRLDTSGFQGYHRPPNPWMARLSGANSVIDIIATIALLIYSYRDCLEEPDECHEECMADPDTTLPLPMLMTVLAISMFAYYSRARPTALLEWAQTTMAVSWIQRMAPLPAIALVTSHERRLALLSDGATAALAGFLVSQRRRRQLRDNNGRWDVGFLVASVIAIGIDIVAGAGEPIEPISVLIGIAVVFIAHFVVCKLRSLATVDNETSDVEGPEIDNTKKTN